MNANQYVVHSRRLSGDSGELISFSRQAAGWDWMSFSARRLAAGEVWEVQHAGEESVHVLLAGMCDVHWGTSHYCIGERKNVFEGLPYALYLAPGERARYTARTVCEIAECHVPAEGGFPSRLLTPKGEHLVAGRRQRFTADRGCDPSESPRAAPDRGRGLHAGRKLVQLPTP